MTVSVSKAVLALLLSGTMFAGAAVAADDTDHPVEKRKFNLPPSAELDYAIRAQQSGLELSGEGVLKWSASGNTYHIEAETRAALFGKILDSKSDGAIDDYGLAPSEFAEKRFRKDPTTTVFHRDSKSISFSSGSNTYPLLGGEQDRASAVWELIAVARGSHTHFKENTDWVFFVAGQHDAEPWTFRVDKMEDVRTAMGNFSAMHVIKEPPPDRKGQKVDIWLAPSLEWYPVRLRYTEPNGDYVEQSITGVNKSK
ncbi:MAG TPA: DUF3108 domain-containing protein [Burkholderiaceae bacterium]